MNLRSALLIPALVLALPLGAEERMKDRETAEVATKALAATDPAEQRSALKRLKNHAFRRTKAPEREFVLFAVGMLQSRLGEANQAADTLAKLEKDWPQSLYLEEAQVILAEEDLKHKKFPEAEGRLRRVLASELPVETKRQAQELLLWTLVEQDKAPDGLDILENLYPLNQGEAPTERGLVAMYEVAVARNLKDRAEALRNEYLKLYKDGPLRLRITLNFALFQSAQGDARAAAITLRKLIQEHPKAPETNNARLALASLILDGKLPAHLRKAFPAPDRLLGQLEGLTTNSDPARKALVLQLKLAVQASNWMEALTLARRYRTTFPTGPEAETVTNLWGESFRAWAQQILEKGNPATLLPQLNPESMAVLLPEQRLSVLRKLAKAGLSEPLAKLVSWAPETERTALRRAALQELYPEAHPDVALGFLPGKKENPDQLLIRAKAELAKARWAESRKALAGARPGPERMGGVLALLRRPAGDKEGPRLREAEAQLSAAPEKGPEREALVILVADLRAKAGDWRGALALYPTNPSKEQLGWVALMRATAQWKLGQKTQAQATLKTAENAEAFKPERQTLAKDLGA
jgi:hypothetical protein